MGLDPNFPVNPHVIIDPAVRWFPGEEARAVEKLENLLPPLVHRIRQGVKKWRDSGYEGASPTTAVLLRHWFSGQHWIEQSTGQFGTFQYFFSQREAVESAVWLYEVKQARDPQQLMQFDGAGVVSRSHFQEDWCRYVMKLATGAGKTKVISLLIAWSYFHKLYEPDSPLSTNFLVIAPNIIVLERLRVDFDGHRIFFEDPVLPENGYAGQNWRDDFQITLHIQDQLSHLSNTGNIFLSNIHRVYLSKDTAPSFDDTDTTDYFLGERPTGRTTDSKLDLGELVRTLPDLVIINDEAHHIHDAKLEWFKSIEDIKAQLRLRGSDLSAQFDLTATPKHNDGSIFVQTISDYPLVEAIRQRVVKCPVLPDAPSRAKLEEKQSDKFCERYEDYLRLGVLEWEKSNAEMEAAGKHSIMFVMTDDTTNCDEVKKYLEQRHSHLRDRVLVIHTKANGEISEANSKQAKDELNELRRLSREVDEADTPYRAIVSVMMLREGWDVQNVTTIVGLRPYKSKSKILPEQTLGRGLRRMFRERPDLREVVSVIGTDAFMDFVESIKHEGVELEYAQMGEGKRGLGPMLVEVDSGKSREKLDELDINLPVLAPRIQRQHKDLEQLDVDKLEFQSCVLQQFSPAQLVEIVFKDIDEDKQSHTTTFDRNAVATPQSVVGYFAQRIMHDLRMVGGYDILHGKIKQFIQERLFGTGVSLDDPNVLRNLSEDAAAHSLKTAFKGAINALTVQDVGTTHIVDSIQLCKLKPILVDSQKYIPSERSVFNKVVGDNDFERRFAEFLNKTSGVVSFAKMSLSYGFTIEYRTLDGSLSYYYPDFVVKDDKGVVWIIETKGRVDEYDKLKFERLRVWCKDVSAMGQGTYKCLLVKEEVWDTLAPKKFEDITGIAEFK